MHHRIGIGIAGTKALPDHQARFAMLIPFGSLQRDAGGDGHIARHVLPDKMEGVGGSPHIRAASRHGVFAALGIVSG